MCLFEVLEGLQSIRRVHFHLFHIFHSPCQYYHWGRLVLNCLDVDTGAKSFQDASNELIDFSTSRLDNDL